MGKRAKEKTKTKNSKKTNKTNKTNKTKSSKKTNNKTKKEKKGKSSKKPSKSSKKPSKSSKKPSKSSKKSSKKPSKSKPKSSRPKPKSSKPSKPSKPSKSKSRSKSKTKPKSTTTSSSSDSSILHTHPASRAVRKRQKHRRLTEKERAMEEAGMVVVSSKRASKHVEAMNAARLEGDLEEAQSHLCKAIKAEPNPHPVLLNELGVLCMEQGNYGDAYDAFSDAILASNQDFVLYKNRAFAELALNQNTAALRDFDRAIDLVCLDKKRATRAYYKELGDGRREALRRAKAHWRESDSRS